MPQQSLLPDHPPMTGLRLEFRAPEPGVRDATEVWIAVRRKGGEWTTYTVLTLPGIEADLLLTLASETVSAWAYGERPKDVRSAAAAVKKQAKAHAAAHEF